MSARHSLAQQGFTLVEAIVVMVITGILGAIVATFLRLPVQNYVDSAGRAELTDVADTAVRRMVREIRLALPNTVRVSGNSIEFVPAKTGGRYLAAEDDEVGEHLNFIDSSDLSFRVVGPLQGGTQQIVAGDMIAVNNMAIEGDAANVYSAVVTNRAVVAAINTGPDVKLITLATNPFAGRTPPMAHPMHRFQVIGQPVSYNCLNGMLYRHANYGFNAVQVAAPSAAPAILATNVESCAFSYVMVGHTRTALVRLTLTLRRAGGNDGAISLMQQVHVDNNP